MKGAKEMLMVIKREYCQNLVVPISNKTRDGTHAWWGRYHKSPQIWHNQPQRLLS